jgi:predicted  nucleic acid-binding Zn-ribbon protein
LEQQVRKLEAEVQDHRSRHDELEGKNAEVNKNLKKLQSEHDDAQERLENKELQKISKKLEAELKELFY